MKSIILSCFFMIFVAGCASNGKVSHWQGESLGSLIATYGAPDTLLKLADGNRVVEYDKYSSEHIAGNFCSLIFMVDRTNRISRATMQGNGVNCVGP